MAKEQYNASDLVELIKLKYKTKIGAYNPVVILEEVADGTGWERAHWIDVAVFQMWKSNNLTRSAFEIKVSRSDLLSELQHPEKHQWCLDCFHEYWIVCPKDIVSINEIPDRVGFMYPKGQTLCIGKYATRNDNPKLNDYLLSSFLRSASKQIDAVALKNKEEALKESPVYQKAKYYADAVDVFLESRNCQHLLYTGKLDKGTILNALNQATVDRELKQDKELLLDLLDEFQDKMIDMVSIFMILANKGILARNDLGKQVIKGFGGNDEKSLEYLKEMNKKRSNNSEYQKIYPQLLENIINWKV